MALKRLFLFCFLLVSFGPAALADEPEPKTGWTRGIEADTLPYLTGGYSLQLWTGKNRLRLRGSMARVNLPGYAVKDWLKNVNLDAYAVKVDYFSRDGFESWWAGGGVEYWHGRVNSTRADASATLSNTALTASIGNNIRIRNGFYLTPYMTVHYLASGDREVPLGSDRLTYGLWQASASIKVGWKF